MQNVAPNCEASVSPDLIRMMRGLAPAAPEPLQEPVAEDGSSEAAGPEPWHPVDVAAPHETVRLRVDGARPLVFRGARLCGTILHHMVHDDAGLTTDIRSELSLFGAEDGRIVAHIAAEPGPGLSALAVYRAAEIWAPVDLAAFVQTATGDVCFGTTPPGHHRPGLTMSGPSAEQGGIHMPLGSPTKQEIAQ